MTVDTREIWRSQVSEDAVTALCLDPRDDGKILCCTYNDSSGCSVIYIIDCKNGSFLHKYDNEIKGQICRLWIEKQDKSDETDFLVIVLTDGTILGLERKASNALEQRGTVRTAPYLKSFLTLEDSDLILTGNTNSSGSEGIIYTYCLSNIRALVCGNKSNTSVTVPHKHKLDGHTAAVLCFAASSNKKLVFSGSYDKTIRVWDAKTWNCLKVLKGHGAGLKCLAVSSDSSLLYSASADNTIRVWSISAGICLRLLHGRHMDTTWPSVMVLHDDLTDPSSSPLLASGSTGAFGGSTIKIFNLKTNSCVDTLFHLNEEQRANMTCMIFSRTGEVLYSAASDGSMVAWSMLEIAAEDTRRAKPLQSGFFN